MAASSSCIAKTTLRNRRVARFQTDECSCVVIVAFSAVISSRFFSVSLLTESEVWASEWVRRLNCKNMCVQYKICLQQQTENSASYVHQATCWNFHPLFPHHRFHYYLYPFRVIPLQLNRLNCILVATYWRIAIYRPGKRLRHFVVVIYTFLCTLYILQTHRVLLRDAHNISIYLQCEPTMTHKL